MSDDKSGYEYAKWKHEQDRAVAERAHDIEAGFASNANHAAVTAGNHAIRALLLINGGAAVAMLAFIGHLAGVKDGKFSGKLPELTAPLAWFAWGVALAAAAGALAYCTNYCIGASSAAKDRSYEYPYLRPTTVSKRWKKGALLFQAVALLVSVAALGTFLCGMTEIRAVVGSLR
ncbi:MAG: hypothetical protein AB7F35_24750 [Acetobacteraceae bacterium]